jgi:CheY-like chemotaxis protein
MKTRIMVIDDDILICRLLTYQLSGAGYTVYAVDNAHKAMEHFWAEAPDLILLDIKMPGMNGWEVCRAIRSYSSVPIIMLTANGSDSDIVAGLEFGADDYVLKPFRLPHLLTSIETVLERARRRTSSSFTTHIRQQQRSSLQQWLKTTAPAPLSSPPPHNHPSTPQAEKHTSRSPLSSSAVRPTPAPSSLTISLLPLYLVSIAAALLVCGALISALST